MFNALNFTKRLEAAGVPREQAEAHAQVLLEVVESELATKRDIKEFQETTKRGLKELEYRLVVRISAIVGAMITLSIGVTAALARAFF